MNVHITGNYQKRRVAEYPSIGEQLDAIWKVVAKEPMPLETQAMFDRIAAIKKKYPKNK
jgi:hypothetical protein